MGHHVICMALSQEHCLQKYTTNKTGFERQADFKHFKKIIYKAWLTFGENVAMGELLLCKKRDTSNRNRRNRKITMFLYIN